MGSAGVRAVSLCQPEVVDKIAHYFVPLVLESDHQDRFTASSSTPAGQKLLQDLSKMYHRSNSLLATIVVLPDGRIYERGDPMQRPADLGEELDRAIASLHLKQGKCLTNYRTNARRADTALLLRVVLRYTGLDFGQRLNRFVHPYSGAYPVSYTSVSAPTCDWIVLSKQDCGLLLPPPEAAVGHRYALPDVLARSMLVHFRPEPALMMSQGDQRALQRVRSARLEAVVCAPGRVLLQGHLHMVHPGLRPESDCAAPSDNNLVDFSVRGWLVWDSKTREVTALSLATVDAINRGSQGGEVFYQGVAYSDDVTQEKP